jgi:hypothetical protein
MQQLRVHGRVTIPVNDLTGAGGYENADNNDYEQNYASSITMNGDGNDNAASVDLELDETRCSNGYATSSCPFTTGSGMNTDTDGDAIVWIVSNKQGYCWQSTSRATYDVVPDSSCSGDGIDWVLYNPSGVSGINVFVNVWQSDDTYSIDGSGEGAHFYMENASDGDSGTGGTVTVLNDCASEPDCTWAYGG